MCYSFPPAVVRAYHRILDADDASREPLSKDLLSRILTRENELRLHPKTQQLYEQAERGSQTDWMEITETLQRNLLKDEYGFKSPKDLDWALKQLRSATTTYPELSSIPLYVKYNRARQTSLKVEQIVPNVKLITLGGEQTNLFDYCSSNRPLVIVSGSYS